MTKKKPELEVIKPVYNNKYDEATVKALLEFFNLKTEIFTKTRECGDGYCSGHIETFLKLTRIKND